MNLNLRKIRSVVAEIFNLYYFAVIFHWRLSSIWILLHVKQFLLSVWFPNLKSKNRERCNRQLLKYFTFNTLRSLKNPCGKVGGWFFWKIVPRCSTILQAETKVEQVLLFCIAIQYWSPGIGIAILLLKTSNTQAIPEKFVESKHVHCSCRHFR